MHSFNSHLTKSKEFFSNQTWINGNINTDTQKDIYDSIFWVAAAWNEISSQTIRNFFTRTGQSSSITEVIESVAGANVDEEEDDEEASLPIGKLVELLKSRKQTARIHIYEFLNYEEKYCDNNILYTK